MKTCIMCNNELTGKQSLYCSKQCCSNHGNNKHQNYVSQQKRGHSRRLELIKSAGGECQVCHYKKNYAALTFHHLAGNLKEFQLDVRKCSNSKWENLLEEAKKCILLCHNCHMEEHYPHLSI